MANSMDGKVAVITGAARGVGLADADLLSNEGATVILTDLNEDNGNEAADRIGNGARFFRHDVSAEADWKALMAMVEAAFGRLDVLVNNAAVLQAATIVDETLEGWQRIQRINSDSVFLGMKYAIPLMEKSGGGSIINMSSSAAICGQPMFPAYSASKAAVAGLTRSVAVYCHQRGNGVRCNTIHPDGIMTPMMAEIGAEMAAQGQVAIDPGKQQQAASYMCKPEDVAQVVLFLASDVSSRINGVQLPVDSSASITAPYQ